MAKYEFKSTFNRITTIAAQTCHGTMGDCNMTVMCVYMKIVHLKTRQ